MSDNNGWDEGTLNTVRSVWGLGIATVMILGAMFFVLPHVTEDGALTRDDLYLIAGWVGIGILIAMPHQAMQGLGAVIRAIKAWRGKS